MSWSAKMGAKVTGCVKCGKTALRRVGTKGYCKEHYSDALRHAREARWQSEYSANSWGRHLADTVE